MNRRNAKLWSLVCVLSILLLLTACGDSLQLTAQQKQGMKLYNALCDRCHKRIPPENHTDAEWQQAVMRYGVKLQLQQQELDAIVAYLTVANDSI